MFLQMFPQDLIEEILPCLPAKTLVRFKSVSKVWSNLISDSAFVHMHSKRAPINILTYTPSGFSLLGHDDYKTDGACNFPPNTKSGVRIVGSCNGLVALTTTTTHVKNFFLWNPSTGAYNMLPNLGAVTSSPSKDVIELLNGFGYDSSTDDYKVFVGKTRHCLNGIEATSFFFSVRSNSWRKVHSSAAFKRPWNSWYRNISGCFAGGALHWLPGEWIFDRYIVALDLNKERFGSVAVPSVGDPDVFNCLNIGALDGRLCLAFYNLRFDCSEIWMMKEYGVHDSWTKLLTLGESIRGGDLLLCISKGDELISINEEKQLIRYGADKTEKFNICKCHPPGPSHPCQAIMCAETLYFPKFPQENTAIGKRKRINIRYR